MQEEFAENSFLWATLTTTSFIMTEKISGIAERMSVAGTSMFDTIASFFPLQMAMNLLSLPLTLLIIFGLFDNSFNGSLIIFSVLLMQIVVLGTLFGFFMAIIHTNSQSVMVSLTLLNSILFYFTGIIRPVEEQHVILKMVNSVIPLSWSIKALQAVRFKNYTFSDPPVVQACLGNNALIVALVIILFYLIKYKKEGFIECMSTTNESAAAAMGLGLF